jgi:hypothetical protein
LLIIYNVSYIITVPGEKNKEIPMGRPSGMNYVLQGVAQSRHAKQQQHVGAQRQHLLDRLQTQEREAPPEEPNIRSLHRYAEWCFGTTFSFSPLSWGTIKSQFTTGAPSLTQAWAWRYEYVRWCKARRKKKQILALPTVLQFLREKHR